MRALAVLVKKAEESAQARRSAARVIDRNRFDRSKNKRNDAFTPGSDKGFRKSRSCHSQHGASVTLGLAQGAVSAPAGLAVPVFARKGSRVLMQQGQTCSRTDHQRSLNAILSGDRHGLRKGKQDLKPDSTKGQEQACQTRAVLSEKSGFSRSPMRHEPILPLTAAKRAWRLCRIPV